MIDDLDIKDILNKLKTETDIMPNNKEINEQKVETENNINDTKPNKIKTKSKKISSKNKIQNIVKSSSSTITTLSKSSKNLDYGHRQRLRESIINNYNAIAKEKIFEYLMCLAIPMRDTRILSKNILEKVDGSFLSLFNKSPEFLRDSLNLPDTIIAAILTVSKIMSLYNTEELQDLKSGIVFDSRNKIFNYFKKEIGSKDTEQTIILFLNSSQKLISKLVFGDNGITKISFNINDIISKMLNCHARFVVLSHNHPSGNPEPSKQDIDTTKLFEESIKYIGEVELVDHIIVSGNKYFSFFENKLLLKQQYKQEIQEMIKNMDKKQLTNKNSNKFKTK